MIFLDTRFGLSLSILLSLILGGVITMSFANPNSSLTSSQPRQGISGTILRLSGDRMPTLGETSARKEPEPVKTTVWIFSGRIPAQGTNWPILQARKHPNLIRQVSSNNEGKFFVELPPGEYTLLAQYDSDLYLNAFLGDGSYATVQVREDRITPINLLNTENAVF